MTLRSRGSAYANVPSIILGYPARELETKHKHKVAWYDGTPASCPQNLVARQGRSRWDSNVYRISSSRGILLQCYKSTKGCQGRKYAHLRGVSAISEYLRHLRNCEVVERILFRGERVVRALLRLDQSVRTSNARDTTKLPADPFAVSGESTGK